MCFVAFDGSSGIIIGDAPRHVFRVCYNLQMSVVYTIADAA